MTSASLTKQRNDQAPRISADAIIAHPLFPEARRVFIAEHREVYRAGVFPGRLGADVGRVTALAIIVCLYANHQRADRESWPTLSKLKTTVARFGFASPRMIDAFIARLVQTGEVAVDKHPDDARARIIRPTATLLAWDRAWMAAHYAPLEVLYPEPGYPHARNRDEAFQLAHAKRAIEAFDGIISMIWSNLDLVLFMSSTSGLIILLSVVGMVDAAPNKQFREADLASLVADFGVSRSHIRNILAAAESKDFLTRSGPRGAHFQLTPRLIAAFDRFIADSLVHSDITYRLGLQTLSEG